MNDRGHLSDLELDLFELGSLSPDERSAADAHLSACERCRSRQTEHGAARERFEKVRAAAWQSIEARAARRPARWLWRLSLALVPVAALLLLVLVRAPELSDPSSPGVKGDPLLRIYALHQGKVRELSSGDKVVPGDRIRFVADPGDNGGHYLLVISVDGANKPSVYVPFAGERSLPLAAGRQELPGSVELDGTLGPERLFIFFSSRELASAPILQALARNPSPEAVTEPGTVFVLSKEAP
ncbi:MAG: zf-HC2 domain-containing protein [Myxococcales bacterium]